MATTAIKIDNLTINILHLSSFISIMINIMNTSELDPEQLIKDAMMNQAVVNIGMIGHVSNGKSTITKALTGIATQKHKSEKVNNITIKLGYANLKIHRCTGSCTAPECYQSTGSEVMEHFCRHCNSPTELITHCSITDVPGHNDYMATMLNGACVMDYSILIESCSNPEIPAPQTKEHYSIVEAIGVKPKVICLNKIDLLLKNRPKILEIMNTLRAYVNDGDEGISTPVIPISGTLECNIDVLCECIAKMAIPKKDLSEDFKMLVIRSFNVNHPRTKISDLKGAVLGGCLMKGIVKLNDEVLVYPGFITKKSVVSDTEANWQYTPLRCKVLSINCEKNALTYAISGGNVGIQVDLDSGLACNDELVGQVIFRNAENPNVKVYEGLKLKYNKLKGETYKIKKGDNLLLNINANKMIGSVVKVSADHVYLLLDKPVCAEVDDKVSISLKLDGNSMHIFGHGCVVEGIECQRL